VFLELTILKIQWVNGILLKKFVLEANTSASAGKILLQSDGTEIFYTSAELFPFKDNIHINKFIKGGI